MAEGNLNVSRPPEPVLQTKKLQIIVQGGLYTSMQKNNDGEQEQAHEQEFMSTLEEAARAGYAVLKRNDSAVDAVAEAVSIMEKSHCFNAGHGSFHTAKGDVECDAMIMDGHNLKAGAVAAVRHIPHPVLLSKKIMENSRHCTLCADGALEFALSNGIQVDRVVGREPLGSDGINQMDTVSAIAMDCNGHLACATSSGGIPLKAKGRIGDAPLIGCGGYANKCGAATTCGHGESIIKMTVAREVVYNIERQHQNAQEAADNAVRLVDLTFSGQDRPQPPYVGVIAMDNEGNIGIAALCEESIPWAKISDNVVTLGKRPGETIGHGYYES